jgi:hypothetical protein
MTAKAFSLPGEVAFEAEIIETRFTNCDDFVMGAAFNQILYGRLNSILIIRMHPNGGPELFVLLN